MSTDLALGQYVEKHTGEARWHGTIVSVYKTLKGSVRYVVEIDPQGFQMVATAEQLRPTAREDMELSLDRDKAHLLSALRALEAEVRKLGREGHDAIIRAALAALR